MEKREPGRDAGGPLPSEEGTTKSFYGLSPSSQGQNLAVTVITLWEGYRESRSCSRDTYPESYTSPSILVYEECARQRKRFTCSSRSARTICRSAAGYEAGYGRSIKPPEREPRLAPPKQRLDVPRIQYERVRARCYRRPPALSWGSFPSPCHDHDPRGYRYF